MSRSVVRQNVRDWLDSEQITGLNQIFVTFPKRVNFETNAMPGQTNRCVAVVFIESESESRLTIGGAYDGWKRVDYVVDLQLFHHSLERKAEDAMDDFDRIVDTIKDRLRAGGHRLGLSDGNVIWQAAEPAISVSYGEPATNNGNSVETWAAINFVVTQMIRA